MQLSHYATHGAGISVPCRGPRRSSGFSRPAGGLRRGAVLVVDRIEILVYNTLVNHYLTIPTRYRGSLRSGLIGPVRLEMQPLGRSAE